MNALQSLISNYLKSQNISRANFAKQLGYTNISKGLKRLDEYLITLKSPNPEIRNLILNNSNISEGDFDLAYSAVAEKINVELSKDFVPSIFVIPIYYPSLLMTMKLLNLKIPNNISELSYEDEIKAICNVYLDFKKKVTNISPSNWGSGELGFRYHRNFGETLVFDKNCRLVG